MFKVKLHYNIPKQLGHIPPNDSQLVLEYSGYIQIDKRSGQYRQVVPAPVKIIQDTHEMLIKALEQGCSFSVFDLVAIYFNQLSEITYPPFTLDSVSIDSKYGSVTKERFKPTFL